MFLVIVSIVIARIAGLTTLDTLILLMAFLGMAASLNIIMGFAGYVSFGHAVFLGIGGYTYVLLVYFFSPLNSLQHAAGGIGAFMVAIIAGLICAIVAASVGAAVLRLRGAFFAIATLGLNFAVLYIVKGIVPTLNPEQFFAAQVILPARALVHKSLIFNAMVITLTVILLTNYIIKKSRFGMGLIAIKEDEDAAEVLGVPTFKYKTLAFAVSAFFTGIIGALISLNGGGVDEAIFRVGHTIDMIVMIVIGGLGTALGPLVGGLIYYWLYDLLLVHYPGINLMILGVLVALIVLFAPEGVIGILRKYSIGKVKLKDVLE